MHPTGPISAKDVRRHYLPWCKRNANEPRGLRRYGTDLGGTKPGQDGTERHQTTRTARDRRSHNPEVADPARATRETAGSAADPTGVSRATQGPRRLEQAPVISA